MHSSEPDVIQDRVRSTTCFHPPTPIDFYLIIALKSKQMFGYLFSIRKNVQFHRVARGALRPLHKITLAKQMIVGKTQKTRLVSPQPAFYITGFARLTNWLHPPTWIDFWLIMTLKFNQCFLLNILCFFRLWNLPSFHSGICPTADFIICRGNGTAVPPPAPLRHSQLKM